MLRRLLLVRESKALIDLSRAELHGLRRQFSGRGDAAPVWRRVDVRKPVPTTLSNASNGAKASRERQAPSSNERLDHNFRNPERAVRAGFIWFTKDGSLVVSGISFSSPRESIVHTRQVQLPSICSNATSGSRITVVGHSRILRQQGAGEDHSDTGNTVPSSSA